MGHRAPDHQKGDLLRTDEGKAPPVELSSVIGWGLKSRDMSTTEHAG